MKISLEWLRQYLPGPLDPQAAADALTNGGLPVEVIEQHGDDTVLDVEVTSNRGDCLSHVGVARELAALLGREFNDIGPASAEIASPASDVTSVRIDAPELCPHYTARVLRNVRIQPSPDWMARRLEAVGLRPINNVVDVTNYVMFETGQPLHAFDFDRLEGRRIVVRRAAAGERLVSIDGRERSLDPGMLVIADATRPVALAGVMGGRDSEVSDTTVNVLLESARFDPLSVRKTARLLAMRSDSSYRFERGIDPALPARASLRAAQLLLETAGGQLLSGVVSVGTAGFTPKRLALRLARLEQVLGVAFPPDAVLDALRRLGLAPVLQGDRVETTIPSHRLDLNLEIDLIEEVARVVGYDKVPVTGGITIRLTPPDPDTETIDLVRSTLVAAGYFEAITFSFVSDALAADFSPPAHTVTLGNHAGATGAPQGSATPGAPGSAAQSPSPAPLPLPRADASVRKADAYLRPSILPGLLEAVRRNETVGTPDARLFEIGSTFRLRPDIPAPAAKTSTAATSSAAAPDTTGPNPVGPVDERRKLGFVGSPDLREVRGVVETLLRRLDPDRPVRVVPADAGDASNRAAPGFAPAASGRIEWGGQPVGHLGKVARPVAEKLGLRDLPAAAELELAPLLAGARHVKQLHALPKFPAVRRDLTLDVPESTRYERIESLVRELKPAFLEGLEYVTTYRGKPLEKGQKSVTLALVFRAPDATLTSEQVEAPYQQIVAAAKDRLGARLRG
jgi:phenylalanyl-tRNA synthetase beta chain